MNLVKLYPRLSFALVFTSIVAHCAAQHALLLVLIAGTMAVLSRYVCEGPRGMTLPRPWSLMLTCAVLIWICVGIISTPSETIIWIGTFVVWLTVIKLYEQRSVENEAERLILSLLLMVLAALVSVDLLYGLLLVGWTALAITVLLLFQLYHGQELVRIERGAMSSGTVTPTSIHQPIVGLGVRRDFRRLTTGMLLFILLCSLVIFISVPRSLTASFLQGKGLSGNAVSGHTSRVDLSGDSRISVSKREVMSVGLQDSAGRSIQLDEPLRLRGAVLERYVGAGIWEPVETRADWEHETTANAWQLLELDRRASKDADSDVILQTFDIVKPLDAIFSISRPIEIRTPVAVELDFNGYNDTMSISGTVAPLRYEIKAIPSPPSGGKERIRWGRYQNPVIREIAVDLLRDAGIPVRRPRTPAEASKWNFEAANVFLAHLASRDFNYTLNIERIQRSAQNDARDPVERFLLVDRIGHCEFFAASFVALCHVVDIESRIVTGFVTDRYDALINRYVVLAADAHAWAEVEITPGVWMTFDPTPPAWTPMGRREPATFAQRMTWIYGWFEDAWQTRVLGFNSESQETIVDDVLPWWTTLTQSTTQSIGEFLVTVNLAFGIGLGGYIWMGVVVMIVVLSIIVWQQGRRRRRIVLKAVSLDSKGQRTERSVARRYVFYVDMLRLLDRADLSKPSWQSPAAFAHSLELTHPNVARCVDRIVQRFYAMRFGGETPAQDHIQRTQEDLHALSSELETLS